VSHGDANYQTREWTRDEQERERSEHESAIRRGEERRPAPKPEPAPARPPAPAAARPAPQLTGLEMAVEQLVAEYTCGAVIDAAWEAAHRLFKPNREKAA
jgi:3-oxoacyl-ACP reductase-like protein